MTDSDSIRARLEAVKDGLDCQPIDRHGLVQLTTDERDALSIVFAEAVEALTTEREAREAAEREREKFRAQLVEAAMRINCAGPVAHRIDMLRKKFTEEGEALQSSLTAAEAVLTRLHAYFSDPRHERPEFKRLIETVLPT